MFILVVGLTSGQDYTEYANDYVQDNLYQDYAQKQAAKTGGGGG